jgi:hypothetical protein
MKLYLYAMAAALVNNLWRNTNCQNLFMVLHHCKNRRFFFNCLRFARIASVSNRFDEHNQDKPGNFNHFCSRAKTTVFQTHFRFALFLFEQTCSSNKNAVCGALMVKADVVQNVTHRS